MLAEVRGLVLRKKKKKKEKEDNEEEKKKRRGKKKGEESRAGGGGKEGVRERARCRRRESRSSYLCLLGLKS